MPKSPRSSKKNSSQEEPNITSPKRAKKKEVLASSDFNDDRINEVQNDQPMPPQPQAKGSIFWMISTFLLILLFGGYLLYETNPQFFHPSTVPSTQVSTSSQSQQQPNFDLPVTLIYDQTDASSKEFLQNQFLTSLVDPQKALKATTLKETWLDYNSAEAQKFIAESDAKYLPIVFVDQSIEKHPQFQGLQGYLQKKGNNYYFRLPAMKHLKTPPLEGGYSKGTDPAKAEIVILEYGSFTCHFCNDMEELLKQAMQEYKGKIALVYKFFDRGSVDTLLAKGAHCADEQKQFWAMHDLLYKDQDNFITFMQNLKDTPQEQGVRQYLEKKAQELRLNKSKFLQCYDSKDFKKSQEQTKEGVEYGANGTPGFFINGKFHDGAFYDPVTQKASYEELKKFIEASMAKNPEVGSGTQE